MIVSDFLAELGRKDIHVWGDGERLRCNAPEGALTADLRDRLRDRKNEILEFLRTAEALARQQPAIVPLQPRGARTPIYGVPGHPGDVFCFSDLVKRLGDDQPFYGLEPPGLDGRREPMDRVEDLAAYFADQIQAFQADGPYIIAGYCSGGATAFELARSLVQRGSTVPLLAMFGTPYPAMFRPLPRLAFNAQYWTGRVLLHIREMAKMPSFDARRRYLGERIRARLKAMNEGEGPATTDPVLARRAKVSSAAITAVRRYAPPRYSGRVCLFLPNKAWLRSGTAPLRWKSVAPNSEAYFGPDTCDGLLMLLEPDAPAFAELFRRSLAKEPVPEAVYEMHSPNHSSPTARPLAARST